eukprot:TRINITY_DN7076_c0_g1_i1.p1 TRINITY_DN7076_c0_g1~~TRINITY_DN7076_c0_g1_i1.p1  ORF type:complete len:667 (-),score=71.73 TRINITY_DN7076_c0_g1_i1:34-2034(-)
MSVVARPSPSFGVPPEQIADALVRRCQSCDLVLGRLRRRRRHHCRMCGGVYCSTCCYLPISYPKCYNYKKSERTCARCIPDLMLFRNPPITMGGVGTSPPRDQKGEDETNEAERHAGCKCSVCAPSVTYSPSSRPPSCLRNIRRRPSSTVFALEKRASVGVNEQSELKSVQDALDDMYDRAEIDCTAPGYFGSTGNGKLTRGMRAFDPLARAVFWACGMQDGSTFSRSLFNAFERHSRTAERHLVRVPAVYSTKIYEDVVVPEDMMREIAAGVFGDIGKRTPTDDASDECKDGDDLSAEATISYVDIAVAVYRPQTSRKKMVSMQVDAEGNIKENVDDDGEDENDGQDAVGGGSVDGNGKVAAVGAAEVNKGEHDENDGTSETNEGEESEQETTRDGGTLSGLNENASEGGQTATPADVGANPLPVLVYFHGGGFVINSIDNSVVDTTCRELCDATRCVVIAVNYRKAPEKQFPTAIEDGYQALSWVYEHGPALFNIDPNRIAVGGDSAGGNIAAVVSLMARDRKSPMKICHMLLVYPALNMTTKDLQEDTRLDDKAPILRKKLCLWFAKQYLRTPSDSFHLYCSPLIAEDLVGLPSCTCISAGHDPLTSDARAWTKRLHKAGVPARMTVYRHACHGFFGTGLGESREAVMEAACALRLAFCLDNL